MTWSDRQDVILTSRMIDAALADHERVDIEKRLTALTLGLVPVTRINNPARSLGLIHAIENRDRPTVSIRISEDLRQVLAARIRMNRRDELALRLKQAAPALIG